MCKRRRRYAWLLSAAALVASGCGDDSASINHAPSIVPMADVNVDIGEPLSIAVSASDPDGDAVVLTLIESPPGATLSGDSVNWTPAAGDVGTAWFVVAATDDGEPSLAAHAGFAVQVVDPAAGEINHAPVLAPLGDQTVDAGDAVSVTITASDPDGDDLTLELVDHPTGMTLTGNTIEWITTSLDVGSYWVSVSATDDGNPAMSAFRGFGVVVVDPNAHVNHAPTITPMGTLEIDPGDSIAVPITAQDPDGDNLTLALVEGASSATLAGTTVSWTSTAADVGAHWFVVSATDDGDPNLVAYAGFRVDVKPPPVENLPPIFFSVPAPGQTKACVDFMAAFEAVDPDGGTITYESPNLPPGAVLTLNGTVGELHWRPAADQVGSYTIAVYAVDDGQPNLSDSLIYVVDVTAPPAAELNVPRVHVTGGDTALVSAAIDPPACYDLSATGPSGSTFDATTGTLSWPTEANDFGVHVVSITATDPGDQTRTFTADGRVAVTYRDDFTAFTGYTVHEVNLGWCCNGPASYQATTDGGAGVLQTQSSQGVDVLSRALRVLDRSGVPLVGVDYEFVARDVVVGSACGSGGLLQLFQYAIDDPSTTWPDWDTGPIADLQVGVPDTSYDTLSGTLVFGAPTSEVTLALLHADSSNICTVDVYWDYVQLIPMDTLPAP